MDPLSEDEKEACDDILHLMDIAQAVATGTLPDTHLDAEIQRLIEKYIEAVEDL